MDPGLKELKSLIAAFTPNSNLTPLPSERLNSLKEDFPGVPPSYLEFLSEIGFGSVGKFGPTIYGGLLEPDEIFDPETAKELDNLLFVGDDNSGWMYAFDTFKSPWEMRLLDHHEVVPKGDDPMDFSSFFTREFKKILNIPEKQ